MTRKLFTILSICFTVNAFAQPVINASDFDLSSTDGYKYKHDFYFEEQLDPGSAGANVSWDFSALDFPWEYSVSFEKCPGADCDRVPTATNHYNSPGGDIYVNKTAAFLEKVGKINDSELSEYTNPYRQIEFPMTFNQIYKDDYVLDSELPATGNLTSTIDAYGTLKTPSGTFSNTLRQKIVDVREVRHPAMVITITDTYYKWYKAGYPYALMTIMHSQSTIWGQTSPLEYESSYAIPAEGTSIREGNNSLDHLVRIYPNPAVANRSLITAIKCTVNEVRITDVLGKEIFNKKFPKSNSQQFSYLINTSDLAKGVYLININTTEGTIFKKLIVQ